MKTSKYILLAITCITSTYALATENETRYLAQITFEAYDDYGKPVPNAEISMSTFYHWEPGEGFGRDITETFVGTTDEDGVVAIQGRSLRGEFSFGPQPKPGYYLGGGGRYQFKEAKEGRWKPWNPVIKILIKPVVNPVPMYARKIGNSPPLEIPEMNESSGFDLMIGDWVAPHGKGKTSDLVFTLKELVPFTTATKPFDYTLTVSFTNEGDGIQSVLSENSMLRTPRYAPESGYTPKLEKQMAIFAEGKPMKLDALEDQNYFFRVRTVLDEQGQVKSALYGKMVGDIKFGVNRLVRFNYYLNPTAMDRNMEFDPQRNLFPRLRSLEKIEAP